MYSVAEVNSNLKTMLTDLAQVKSAAVYLLNKISHDMPDSFVGAGDGEMSPEDAQAVAPGMEGGDQGATAEPGAPGEEGKPGEKKAPEIKTPEEAKKTVNEAITDLKAVVDGIDNISEQGSDMADKTSSQTFRLSSKAQSEIGLLTKQAIAAIEDAQGAVKHWAFLLQKKTVTSASNHPFVESVKQGVQVWKELGQVLATAVPPTGAEFTGDKLAPKRPEKVEIDHYKAGNEKFHGNKTKEDAQPNPAAEPRLTDEGNPHELGAYVNAKAVAKNDKFSSAVVFRSLNKEGKGKFAVVTWDGLSETIGKKNAENYAKFMSPAFASAIEQNIKRTSLDAVAAYVGAEVGTIGLEKTAREPKVEDKGKLREYYKDAFGDAEYAKDLTSNQQGNAKTGVNLGMGINQEHAQSVAKGGDEMNVGYKPEQESAEAEKGGLEGGRKNDSLGDGSAPTKDASLEVRQAKARKAVEFARTAASRGLIPFTKQAIKDKALEVVAYSDEKFAAQLELLNSLPIAVEAATKEGHIPDTDSGIVGDRKQGVRNPQAKSETEGLQADVKADAKISQASIDAQKAKTAAVVPQMQVASNLTKESFVGNMNTLQNRLAKKGIVLADVMRRVGPHYKQH